MTLTKSIVELHGGRVETRSEGPGRGSEFRIWLPLLPASERTTDVRTRILVVDDIVDSAELLSFLLQTEGHKVTVANSGADTIDIGTAWMDTRRQDACVPQRSFGISSWLLGAVTARRRTSRNHGKPDLMSIW